MRPCGSGKFLEVFRVFRLTFDMVGELVLLDKLEFFRFFHAKNAIAAVAAAEIPTPANSQGIGVDAGPTRICCLLLRAGEVRESPTDACTS